VFIPIRVIFLAALPVLLLAACQTNDTDLASLNCQLEDIPTTIPYVTTTPITTPPTPELLGEEVVSYHLTEFNEQSLTYQTIRCEMIRFADDAAAARAFTTACTQAQTGETITDLGESSCLFGEGMETLVFQYEEIVVSILADVDGMYAHDLAEIVVGRLR
jgi:hypothetical protein